MSSKDFLLLIGVVIIILTRLGFFAKGYITGLVFILLWMIASFVRQKKRNKEARTPKPVYMVNQ